MQTHRAVRFHRYGGPEVLIVEDAPIPQVGPQDVLIEVHASSVNPIDWKIRRGSQRGAIHYRLPHTLGLDLSGVIVKIGERVSRFRVGDEVFSSPTHRRPGTHADFCAVDENAVALKPKSLSHWEAASLPLCGLTAWEALVVVGRTSSAKRVFVQAGAGGVGTLAIQLAKSRGAYVATVCSSHNEALCRKLGADVVVDRSRQRYDEVLSNYDVALDSLGGVHQRRTLSVLHHGGILTTIVSGLPDNTDRFGRWGGLLATGVGIVRLRIGALSSHGVTAKMVVRKPDGQALAELARLVDKNKLRPVVHARFPLERIADAHRESESGRVAGKIVIEHR